MNLKIALISICLSLLQQSTMSMVVAAPAATNAPLIVVTKPIVPPIVRPAVVTVLKPIIPPGFPVPKVINRFGFVVGKRNANNDSTECIINTEEHKLTCTGQHELTCDIAERLKNFESSSALIVKDLRVKLAKTESKINDILMNIQAEKEVDKKISIEDYTFLNPIDNKPIFLHLYSSDNLKHKSGFQFKEDDCLKKFSDLMSEVQKQQNYSFELIIKNTKSSMTEASISDDGTDKKHADSVTTTASDATVTTVDTTTSSQKHDKI